MAPLSARSSRPVVLLTNDDGPPSNSSPNVFGLAKLLRDQLGWDVRVVLPDCQKSWVGKAYAISDIVQASYFYPLEPEGLEGEITPFRRPLKDGETMEWMLVSGTPATCANIALHHLYPDEIDLVISGPNHGRNSSNAFALSSGTIGAALDAVLAVPYTGRPLSASTPRSERPMPAIAISYGLVERPCPPGAFPLAHEVALEIIQRLWDDWGYECTADSRAPAQLYTVNIPLVVRDLEKERRKTVWAGLWRTTYGSLFKRAYQEKADYVPGDPGHENKPLAQGTSAGTTSTAGPAALPTPSGTPAPPAPAAQPLRFKFGPSMAPLLNPALESLPHGCDAWAFAQGWSSVVPVRAEFGGSSKETWYERETGKRVVEGEEFD